MREIDTENGVCATHYCRVVQRENVAACTAKSVWFHAVSTLPAVLLDWLHVRMSLLSPIVLARDATDDFDQLCWNQQKLSCAFVSFGKGEVHVRYSALTL